MLFIVVRRETSAITTVWSTGIGAVLRLIMWYPSNMLLVCYCVHLVCGSVNYVKINLYREHIKTCADSMVITTVEPPITVNLLEVHRQKAFHQLLSPINL